MSNTTATGGYLTSATQRYNINHMLHDFICGILNLSNNLVRPKNQPVIAPPPPFGTNWVAFGISNSVISGFAYLEDTNLERTETYDVSLSVYGNDSENNIKNFRDALEIKQNWDYLNSVGISFKNSNNIMRIPELHNGRWLQRFDMSFVVSQKVNGDYGILTFEQIDNTNAVLTDFNIER